MSPGAALLLLVSLLSADDFATRLRAESALRAALPHSVEALEAGERGECPETAGRCRRLLDRHAWETAPFKALAVSRAGRLPWVDMLPPEYPGTWTEHYQEAVRRGAHDHGGDWPAYRQATRLLLEREFALRRLTEAEAAKLCVKMWAAGHKWAVRNAARPRPE